MVNSKKTEIIPSIFSDHNEVRLDVNYRRKTTKNANTFTYELALALTRAVLRPILFLIAFVVVLILWYFLSHALDLVAHLPLLSTLNAAGGFLFGAVKGGLLLMVAALLIRHFKPDLIPDAALEASRVLKLLQKAPPLF